MVERVESLPASRRDIAFVFQLYSLYPHMTAFENIAFPLRAFKTPNHEVRDKVNAVAKVLRIEHLLGKRPSALAGGDLQRVTIGRALVRRPKAMLMDEPIGALDAKLREEMRTELRRLHVNNNSTTVYVTHDQVEAMSMADRIAIMNDGVLQQVGSPTEVYSSPTNLFVAQFVGSPIMNVVDCTVEAYRFIDQGSFRWDAGSLPLWRRGAASTWPRPGETVLRWACDPRPYWLSARSDRVMSRQMFT